MKLLHFQSHHPLSREKGITYGHHIQKQTFFQLSLLSQTWENHLYPLYIRIGTQLLMTLCVRLSGHLNLYLPTQNPAAFTTILSIPYKHMAHHNTILYTAIHIHLHTPKHTGKQTHNNTLFISFPLKPPPN